MMMCDGRQNSLTIVIEDRPSRYVPTLGTLEEKFFLVVVSMVSEVSSLLLYVEHAY